MWNQATQAIVADKEKSIYFYYLHLYDSMDQLALESQLENLVKLSKSTESHIFLHVDLDFSNQIISQMDKLDQFLTQLIYTHSVTFRN